MSNVKIVLNPSGMNSFLNSDEIVGVLDEAADEVMARLGSGYDKNTYHGPRRANVSIATDDEHAFWDNYHHNTLLKALGG